MAWNTESKTFLVLALLTGFVSYQAQGACGTTITYNAGGGGSKPWGDSKVWSPKNVPNADGENAVVACDGCTQMTSVDGDYTVSCIEVTTGKIVVGGTARTFTITDDYFKAVGSDDINNSTNLSLNFTGSAAQALQNANDIATLTINNTGGSTVTVSNGEFTASTLSFGARCIN